MIEKTEVRKLRFSVDGLSTAGILRSKCGGGSRSFVLMANFFTRVDGVDVAVGDANDYKKIKTREAARPVLYKPHTTPLSLLPLTIPGKQFSPQTSTTSTAF